MSSPIVELANSKENRKSLFPDIFMFTPVLRWRRTLAHEYLNELTFRDSCLLLKLYISEFLQSIPLKLNGDIVESWNYIMIVILLEDRALR